MNTNSLKLDEIYRIVGEEVSQKEYQPGAMAKAVEEAQGNRDLVQPLYIKFRREELVRQMAEEQRAQAEELCRKFLAAHPSNLICPKCGHVGKPKLTPCRNDLVLLLLWCLFVVPGVIYAYATSSRKAFCAKCGYTLINKV
jgi:ribosomal protein S27AE